MKLILRYSFFLISLCLFSQNSPQVILKDSSNLKLSHLKVSVNITGNFATTIYDMKFYNGLDRTLEGELAFPLGEGQVVSKFAMDVNGKLRDAVIVEKELARVAYESTVRQNIDPGLLEKTQGNNYKARVYPILPKSYKHIVITYEQELFSSIGELTYELPLGIHENIDQFSISIEAYSESLPTIINNGYDGLFFKKNENLYKAELTIKSYAPKNPIVINIPTIQNEGRILTYNDYFYVHKTLAPNSKLKVKPKEIIILWDASFSMKNRKLEEELKLLDNYINYLQSVDITFISFNNAIQTKTKYSILDSQWDSLKTQIRNVTYDGGTCLSLFKDLNLDSDETLLFSDGLSNLGNYSKYNKEAIYTINSMVSANHEELNNVATNSGGNYINLIRLSYPVAISLLKHEVFQFLGVRHNKNVQEIYPNKNTNVTQDFSISGKFSNTSNIELLFGYGGKVTKRIPINIKRSEGSKLVTRLWAKQKLKSLTENKKENKEAIITLAKKHNLITDFTSLLILDRLEDYVRYRIEPPQELKREYKERIKEFADEEMQKKSEIKERIEDLFEEYKDILNWYATKYPKKEIKTKKVVQSQSTENTNQNLPVSGTTTQPQNNNQTRQTRTIVIDSTKRIITGTLLDESGNPLPGANIIIRGTSNGTQTDFDGNFVINAEENDELEISYIGYVSKKITVGNNDKIDVQIEADSSTLDEVVVVGYGTQRRSSITSSVTTVTSGSLAGRVAGVSITRESDASSQVTIRGNSSLTNNTPLYIVDGVISETNPTESLKPEDIESMQVLKNSAATALYGSRASNGLIVIVTKKGREDNKDIIEELDKKISEEIELKPWNPDTPYINILEKEPTVTLAYKKYLDIRSKYSNSPSFYLDVADFFDKKAESHIAITVLTNLIEVDLDNHELMKALAYKLEYFKQYNLATIIYEKVLELRPEEPQSYRDLALAYEHIGEFQKSFNLLYKIYNGDLLEKDEDERYYGIEHIAYVELSRLVSKYGKELKLTKSQRNEFNEITTDVRVVIDWNHNDTDIDLWVTDPKGEKAFYKNPETKIGGRMSDDLTEGYGPEEFMLKKAINGNYKVSVDYYSDNVQKISGPTFLKVVLFTNYAKKNESRKIIVIRLDKEEDELEIGNLNFDN